MKLLVVADDLTGALDTGVQFVGRGIPVRLVVHGQKWCGGRSDGDEVVILNAVTRRMKGTDAYKVVKDIVEEACRDGVECIYKKTDSAQRGNIGCELQAVLDGAGQEVLHYTPAFPRMGRITRRGVQYVDGVPVAESVFGQDPYEPVKHSYLPDIIREQSDVPLEAEYIKNEGQITGKRIHLYDADSEEALDRAARRIAAQRHGGEVLLLAGSAGLAASLCRILSPQPRTGISFHKKEHFLVVAGSLNPVTGRQLDHAAENGFTRIRLGREHLTRDFWGTVSGKRQLESWKKLCRENQRIILDANDAPDEISFMDYATGRGWNRSDVRSNVEDIIGYVVNLLLQDLGQTVLMTVGGDTTMSLMERMGVQELALICQLQEGVVCSEFEKGGKPMRLLSKSGGFGRATLLTELAEMVL